MTCDQERTHTVRGKQLSKTIIYLHAIVMRVLQVILVNHSISLSRKTVMQPQAGNSLVTWERFHGTAARILATPIRLLYCQLGGNQVTISTCNVYRLCNWFFLLTGNGSCVYCLLPTARHILHNWEKRFIIVVVSPLAVLMGDQEIAMSHRIVRAAHIGYAKEHAEIRKDKCRKFATGILQSWSSS